MTGLKVYPDGTAEIKDISPSDFNKEVCGESEEYRPFVDKTIVMIINKEATVREGRNTAIPFAHLNGTVLFMRAKGKAQNYVNLDDEKIERLIERFPKIKIKEKTCETSPSLPARFKAWLTRILKASRRQFLF